MHDTFENYCRERWGWSRRHVNYQIEAAGIVDSWGTVVPKPTSERQLRPLRRWNRKSSAPAVKEANPIFRRFGYRPNWAGLLGGAGLAAAPCLSVVGIDVKAGWFNNDQVDALSLLLPIKDAADVTLTVPSAWLIT